MCMLRGASLSRRSAWKFQSQRDAEHIRVVVSRENINKQINLYIKLERK